MRLSLLCAQDFSSGLQTLGDGTCIASLAGSDTKNFTNMIVPKKCAPKTCQSFQTLGHGTCIASLAGSETKRAELLAGISGQIPSTRLSRKTGAKDFSNCV